MSNPTPINPDPKRLIDRCAAELAGALELNLDWLTKAYGKADLRDLGNGLVPVIYTGTHDDTGYLGLLPDRKLGNYCFLLPDPKQDSKHFAGFQQDTFQATLIFSFDIRDVYPDDHEDRTIENVKYDIKEVLSKYNFSSFVWRHEKTIEGAKNIFAGVSHKEVNNQFDLRPHMVLGLRGTFKINEPCNDDPQPVLLLPTESNITLERLDDGPKTYVGSADKFVRVNPDGDGFIFDEIPAIGGITNHSELTLDDGNNPHSTDTPDIAATSLSDDYEAIYILAKNS